jgi:alkanesulfonate monooxygenase SsuD/methylene tetrahydromethanopterin reductase-like flavin-dependent oxidoreductase (luciferase family)
VRAGLNLPQYTIDFSGDVAGTLSPDAVVRVARAAEEGGFDSVWLSDHPFAIGPDGTVSGALEATTTMAYVAAATSRVTVGSLVLAASMRSPEQLARAARSLGLVAPSRVVVGLGTGWYEPEHRAYGVSLSRHPHRIEFLRSSVLAVKKAGATVLVGGVSQSVIDVVASDADAWNCAWDVPAHAFHSLSKSLDEMCLRFGRDPATASRSVGVTVLVGARAEMHRAVEAVCARAPFLESLELSDLENSIVTGSAEECAERIAAYGADEVVITPFVRDDLELIARIADEVLPRLPGRDRAGSTAAGSGSGATKPG